ncbi:hypothetical protein TeGR_g10028 [Tetraparma gracilis]|uniref:Uncharacterized protein n=1 Tax=Tetraparma gracilis TaxID=2962635 RepID=A0ABQ6M675_9STRA|nr:hypothetical protein TeGR_g10028 [Tetraparma gracilis]
MSSPALPLLLPLLLLLAPPPSSSSPTPSSAPPAPPPLPLKFQTISTSTYTSPGFYAGVLDIAFTADCSLGPASQRLRSVYPDGYTVFSDCAAGTRYITEPSSRGDACSFETIREGEECGLVCGSPFSVRDTDGVYTFGPGMEVEWSSRAAAPDNANITQFTGSVARGSGSRAVVVNVTSDDEVVGVRVESDDWFIVDTTLERTNGTFDESVWDVPAGCEPSSDGDDGYSSSSQSADASSDDLNSSSQSADASSDNLNSSSQNADASSPPSFPAAWSATLVTGFANPGYNAGNVFTNTTAHCPSPSAQISRTTFGNFHTVQQDCGRGLIFDYDLEGFNCFVTPIGEGGVDARICGTCTMPFGLRDSGPLGWTFRGAGSDRSELDVADWAAGGAAAWAGTADGGAVRVGVEVDGDGGFVRNEVEEEGWIRADVSLSDYKELGEEELEEKFKLPACFDGLY